MLTRRKVFAGLALATATPAATASAPREEGGQPHQRKRKATGVKNTPVEILDPIHAVIERFRTACAAFEAAAHGDAKYTALAKLNDAADELTTTTPATLAGLAAVVACVDDIDPLIYDMDVDRLWNFIAMLREATDRLAIEALRVATEAHRQIGNIAGDNGGRHG